MKLHDLYRLVNGPWIDNHEIPADRGADGVFLALRDQAEEDVHAIVQEEKDSLAGVLYQSFMDTDGVNSAGTGAIDEDIRSISTESAAAFLSSLGKLDATGVSGLLNFWVAKDSASEDAVAYVFQSGLGLPNEAYYREQAQAEILAAYEKHVVAMLGFLAPDILGVSPTEAAARIVSVEKSIAAGHWDVVASRDAIKTNNPTEFADLPDLIQTYLRAMGLPEHRLNVRMPDYLDHLISLFSEESAHSLEDFRLWTLWHILLSRAAYLSEEISAKDFEFYGTVLSGATEQRARWKRAVATAEGLVGEEIGQHFVQRHFPPSSKTDMLELVDYLIKAYHERISALQWMSPATRERALEKLAQFRAKIGYTDSWRDYSALDFSPLGKDLVANVRAGAAFEHEYQLSTIGAPIDRDRWHSTPQTVNAFYNPTVNDITFPAAILRPPFYSPDADAAENFGAIGAVIGHEIGHGFDDQGSQYDGQGNLHSWWTPEDREAFSALTSQLVEQFTGLVPHAIASTGAESAGVNGEFTLGENIGDLGGLGVAVIAYRNYLADQGLDFASSPQLPFEVEGAEPELSGQTFNGLQRLFLSWARVWRSKTRPEVASNYLLIDPHSPAEFRCNVIAGNIAELYEAFDVQPDSPMWIDEDKRVSIW
ncbi:M13 family metallopeptidase [Corynebacterium sp. sy039]|uniref:M13 family metallopeptidase n=1 Tax=Corynebacterium sp. sy039 TaxID=2599641 RepID=UPI0011B718CA|nr:M13-type metalloendopeptidase [Corynebacterium sp. sy039]QDZ41790.1 peptidase M13 [Corynebacterium sp. sy039]